MISGAAQADVALLMVPADGNFTTAIQKGDVKSAEIQGQTRAHARLLNLLGVKQLLCGVNKMDSDTAGYKEERYKEIAEEMRHMLVKVGWKDDFVKGSVPILPISGWQGDNLIAPSTNMGWWKGVDVKNGKGETVHVHTLLVGTARIVLPGIVPPTHDPAPPLPLRTPSTCSLTSPSARPMPPCVCPSRASTRSRVLVMLSPAVSSRASSSPETRSSSCPPTPPPWPAPARSSRSRCTTSVSRRPCPVTTSA